MSDKYRQAIANAMRGKCIPHKKETKAALNEMLGIVQLYNGCKEKNITHYDRIKSFSVEEMAEFICGLCEDQDNYLGYIEWLKSEVGTNVNNNDKSPET